MEWDYEDPKLYEEWYATTLSYDKEDVEDGSVYGVIMFHTLNDMDDFLELAKGTMLHWPDGGGTTSFIPNNSIFTDVNNIFTLYISHGQEITYESVKNFYTPNDYKHAVETGDFSFYYKRMSALPLLNAETVYARYFLGSRLYKDDEREPILERLNDLIFNPFDTPYISVDELSGQETQMIAGF